MNCIRWTVLLMLLAIIGCSSTPSESDPAALSVARLGKSSTNRIFEGTKLAVLDDLQIQQENGRSFVQVDDMRFAIEAKEIVVKRVGGSGDSRSLVSNPWPWGRFVYHFSPEVRANSAWVAQFVSACELLTSSSGIHCIDRAKQKHPSKIVDYAYIIRGNGNYSYVGQVGGRQELSVVSWGNRQIIAHEIKHALGWTHEHQRPDRDSFVRVNHGNFDTANRHNFTKMGRKDGTAYDFESIMHYSSTAFSNNGQRTIDPLGQYQNQLAVMGQRSYISQTDTNNGSDSFMQLRRRSHVTHQDKG